MTDTKARTLLLSLLAALAFALLGQPFAGGLAAPPKPLPAERVVYLAGELPPAKLVTLTATIAAGPQPGTLLLYSPRTLPALKTYLRERRIDRIIPVGHFPGGFGDLERKLEVAFAPPIVWLRHRPEQLWDRFFPTAERVVVCPAEPRAQLLQAACFAGVAKAPLFVTTGRAGEREELRRRLDRWKTAKVYAVGDAAGLCDELKDRKLVQVKNEQALASLHAGRLSRAGGGNVLVVANPADDHMGPLATWVALERKAALVLTNPAGDNAEEVVRSALTDHRLHDADALIFVAAPGAIPMLRRRNPIPDDRDKWIEMEPFTPQGNEPYTFATGRLFHEDRAAVPLMLARQRELARAPAPRVLAASNAGSSLPMLELFTRSTVQELRNAGLETTAMFGRDVKPDALRREMPEHDIFLWEGHHNTLMIDWAFTKWDEPLRPSLVFLQSCLALMEGKVFPLFDRGAVGVVGSSTRIYSATGGAYTLAFFDALLYERQSVGGALRHAKNYLHAVALLKRKRLGAEAKRTGANERSAWAFTLWGDPTLKLPSRELPAEALPPVRHEVRGSTLVLAVPETRHARVVTPKYQTQIVPNARLAGLVRRELDAEAEVVPVVFAEVSLPQAPAGFVPKLSGRVPPSHWVFTWDARRRCGYLLVAPRAKDRGELRFHIDWTAAAEAEPAAVGGQ